MIEQSWKGIITAAAATTGIVTVVAVSPQIANAACIQGDLRPECIGVYKVPNDGTIKEYIGTPELIKEFAPDLKYVDPIKPPKSIAEAIKILKEQKSIAQNDIKTYVSQGKLEAAGTLLLETLPRINISGRYVVQEVESRIEKKNANAATTIAHKNNNESSSTAGDSSSSSSSSTSMETATATTSAASSTSTSSSSSTEDAIDELKMTMIENQYDLMNGYWGETDIVIGQGLRGELGVSAVAQLTILSTLLDATCALDDFVSIATKNLV